MLPTRLFQNRKGIELSVNFLVTFILAVVLFAMGMVFARNLFTGSTEIVDISQDQLDAAIENMFCTNSEVVCVNMNAKTLPRNEEQIFGVTILNIFDPGDIRVTITSTKRIEKDNTITDLSGVPVTENLEIFPDERTFPLAKNKDERVGFMIRPRSTTPKGKYIVDVDVAYEGNTDCDGDGTPGCAPYGTKQKIYITVI